MPLKTLLVIFGLLVLSQRLFYFQLDKFFGGRTMDMLFIVLLVSALILLILTVIKATKKDFKPLLIYVFIIATLYFLSFEYLVGWIKFELNNSDRSQIVAGLKNGIYDDILFKEQYPQYGMWIENHKPRFKIFKDTSLEMAFIWQGNIRTQEEYCGQLYISDRKKIDDKRIYEFLGREFRKKYLGNNWYWVDCYVDRTAGP